MPVNMTAVCPVHGVRFTFVWSGECYMMGKCAALMPEESKAAGRLIHCEETLQPERGEPC